MFVLGSDITIGKFRFSGVNEVIIERSLHELTDYAMIKVPSIAKIIKDGKIISGSVVTGKQFNEGDPVTVRLGYNGQLNVEFKGFVKRKNMNMPLEIECEGYSWLLRRNNINKFYASVKVKDLLNVAIGTNMVNVICDADIELNNVQLTNSSGVDVLKKISEYTDGSVFCFFVTPDTLWCGYVYTPISTGSNPIKKDSVRYELGFNVIKNNTLKQRQISDDPVTVEYIRKSPSGEILKQISDVLHGSSKTHSRIMNHVNGSATLKALANEKALRLSYTGYEGEINAFLEPFVGPGFAAYLTDNRYPEMDGTYLVESTNVQFGQNGARRKIELGPKIGFAKDQKI